MMDVKIHGSASYLDTYLQQFLYEVLVIRIQSVLNASHVSAERL